jgi:hypothetical protein
MDIRSVILTGLLPITTSLFGLSFNLNAADLKYTYAEAKYFVSSDSTAADDADGFGFNGSYRINHNLFALAEFSNVEGDDIEVETQRIFGGLGYIHPISSRWNSELMFVFGKIDLDVPRGTRDQNGRLISDDDDTGYILKTGAHTMLSQQLELRAHVCYQSFFDDSWTSLELSSDYHVKPDVSASLGFVIDNQGGTFTIGGKVYF